MTTHHAAQVRNSSIPGTRILDCSGGRAVDVVFASDDLAKVTCKRCLKKAGVAPAAKPAGRYFVKCDDCRKDIGRTDSMRESAEGGRCDECKRYLAKQSPHTIDPALVETALAGIWGKA
jgi:predicted nucleic acid-binding Zn ribbon protein